MFLPVDEVTARLWVSSDRTECGERADESEDRYSDAFRVLRGDLHQFGSSERAGSGVNREDQLRGWVGVVVTEDEVLAIEVDKEVGEHEHHQKRPADQKEDQEKVRLLLAGLLDFHAMQDARLRWDVDSRSR